jgi:hypothetical protein
MALWGNKDSKTATGTVSIADTGVVTGSSTLFTTEAKVGNTIRAADIDYHIVSITSNTVAKVRMGKNNGGGLVAICSGQSYTLSEKPSFVPQESADSGIGIHGDSNKVFGVDATESSAGSDNVTGVALSFAGTGYTEATHTATVTGGGGSSAAITYTGSAAAPGTITSVDVTNVGSGYTSVPTITFGLPRRTINTTFINTTTNVISYPGHLMNAGDVVKYFHGGGAAATGLTNDTTYYVIASGLTTNTFKVSATDGGTEVDISGTGNNAQYFELQGESRRATAVASLGAGASGTTLTHAGWVRRTVGTGGRAGRVQQEVLVAMGSMTGDQDDDIQYPDS